MKDKTTVAVIILAGLLEAAFAGVVIYVICHFISKFW